MTKSYYPAMVELRHQLRAEIQDSNFEILAFPCSQFGNQEFPTSEEIKEFVKQFKVDFPMFASIDVNGPKTHEIFQFLKYNSPELSSSDAVPILRPIGWNFGKFLIDGSGHVVKYYGPKTPPMNLKEDCIKVIRGELHGTSRDPPKEIIEETEEKKEGC